VNEEYRQIEVVEVGSGPPKPPKPPRATNRTDLLLTLLVVGVFLGAAASAYAAWIVRETQQDSRLLNCMYVGVDFTSADDTTSYDDLPKKQQELVDRFDCDVPGR